MNPPDADESRGEAAGGLSTPASQPAMSSRQPPSTKSVQRMVRTRKRLAKPTVREALRLRLKRKYEAGASIRELGVRHRLSLLLEAGVTLRSRGGPNHRRKNSQPGGTP